MLDVILVAANLWLCPGDVYTDRQATGCKEVKESNEKEGFSRSQEAPEFGSSSNAASRPGHPAVIWHVPEDSLEPDAGRFSSGMYALR